LDGLGHPASFQGRHAGIDTDGAQPSSRENRVDRHTIALGEAANDLVLRGSAPLAMLFGT
jgi:hypothetical protein